MAKRKNSVTYRISDALANSQSTLPLALYSDEHLTISALETWLWDAACAIRGATDAPKFKDFILPLIFYKRLSDVFDDECQTYIEHFGDEELARLFIAEDHRHALAEGHTPIVRFYIPDEYRWIHLRNHPTNSKLGEFVTDAMKKVAELNPTLRGVIDVPASSAGRGEGFAADRRRHEAAWPVWHTQGSGKTLTMITIASRLLQIPKEEKPTVIMVIDRTELENQLFKNIQAYGISNFEVAESKQDLQKILDSDYRGLVVSMIHKFDNIRPRSSVRKSIIILIDEAHRSTSGGLGDYLMGALPNAMYIGFTGTPIDRLSQGKGTFKVFGVDDEQGYLDKYSIAESIEDNTTVKLNYALAPSQLRVDRDTLEKQFLNLTQAEGVIDIAELNAILDRAVELKEIMKAPQRIDNIARYVAEHFTSNVAPMGFKAFLVVVDREFCVLYKRALEKYLPMDWVEAVYSPSHDDKGDLKTLALRPEEEKTVRRDFLKKNKLPKILVVTEKLLTGYDAPILYCMYLDKPMRDHVMLQAIARVNRPYEDDDGLVKPCGFVLDNAFTIYMKLKQEVLGITPQQAL